jgi:HD-GYP domain-containing protein (c-di-GMP phosphodiesterase class II)
MENEKDRRIRQLEQLVQERTAQLSGALEQLEQAYDSTMEALGAALDLKGAETEGHCQRVTAFCISIAKTMPVPDGYLAILARAAFLHDIGKIAIPDGILRKPGALNDDEKQIMRKHCEIGHNMLMRTPSCGAPRRFCWSTRNSLMEPAIHAVSRAKRFPWGRGYSRSRTHSMR